MHFITVQRYLAQAADPISAILARDWAAVGGWSLFIGLGMTVILGAFREWWVPAPAMRRLADQLTQLEASSKALTEANLELRKQNTMLIQANRITEHFFAETTPKRGETEE